MGNLGNLRKTITPNGIVLYQYEIKYSYEEGVFDCYIWADCQKSAEAKLEMLRKFEKPPAVKEVKRRVQQFLLTVGFPRLEWELYDTIIGGIWIVSRDPLMHMCHLVDILDNGVVTGNRNCE